MSNNAPKSQTVELTKILYVEDDESLARLVQRHLGRAGFAVDCVVDGEQGLEAISNGDYQIVLLDYLLPGIDGLSLVRKLVDEDRLPPTIMVSGMSEFHVAVDALKLGVADFILKELDSGFLERLPELIERVLHRHQLLEEKEHAEAALLDAKKAAEMASQAKTRFLAAASHDLRQPLQSIALMSSILGRKIQNPEVLKIVDEQKAIILAMSETLNTLLDIGRLEAGVMTPQLEIFPARTLLEKVDIEFRRLAQAKGIELRLAPTSAMVLSDPIMLERIVMNLVSNAIKYTDKGKVLVGCRRHNGRLRFEVWDSGIGIPGEMTQLIFETFYQIDNTARESRKGLGLGLSIVDQLSRLLGYELNLHSILGKGSYFSVEVPLAGLDRQQLYGSNNL